MAIIDIPNGYGDRYFVCTATSSAATPVHKRCRLFWKYDSMYVSPKFISMKPRSAADQY